MRASCLLHAQKEFWAILPFHENSLIFFISVGSPSPSSKIPHPLQSLAFKTCPNCIGRSWNSSRHQSPGSYVCGVQRAPQRSYSQKLVICTLRRLLAPRNRNMNGPVSDVFHTNEKTLCFRVSPPPPPQSCAKEKSSGVEVGPII